MTSNSTLAYPAEYYYPEFSDNRRPDDPHQSPRAHLPLTTGMDHISGGTSARMPQAFKQNIEGADRINRTIGRKGSTTGKTEIATNHGLPDADITQAVQTDPKKSLLRDPVEKNIPRLIVDDSIFKQTLRTTKHPGTDGLGFDQVSETNGKGKRASITSKSSVNGSLMNGGLPNGKAKGKTPDLKPKVIKHQPKLQYIDEEEPPIDDFWKKEVHIDDEGAVTIEPLKYDKSKYEGPFGLTRQAATVFFVVMIILTVLAGVFLILTGIFYSQNYPDSTNNTAKVAGMAICGFVFYFGLQLILIALWHQRYRQENPKKIISKASLENDSTAQLQNTMETNEQFEYPYGQPIDYSTYGAYPPAPYIGDINDPTLYQQPTGMAPVPYYDSTGWQTNTADTDGLDPRFLQPMEMSYGLPTNAENSTVSPYPTVPLTTVDTTTKSKKKGRTTTADHSKTVEAHPPKAKFDDLYPNSTVTETEVPHLRKAPETNDLLRSIAEIERTKSTLDLQGTSFAKSSKKKKKYDGESGAEASNDQNGSDRHRRHRRRHHRRHRHRRSSYSPCSTCSDRSHEDYHSEVNVNPNLLVQPEQITANGRGRTRARTLSPSTSMLKMNQYGRTVKDSGVSVGLEDVPNVADDRLEQIPVVRRTIIVEPYPASPTTKVVVKPNDPSGKKGKKKKKTVTDIHLEDVNDDDHRGYATTTKKPRIVGNGTTGMKQRGRNAFQH